MKPPNSIDAIVIGAGMSGLTFAARMAQAGQRVLVLEQHYLPGGLFTAFKADGYTFNVGLEWTTDCAVGEPFYDLLAALQLADAYPFRALEIFKTVRASELPQPLRIWCDRQKLRRELCGAFPHQEAAIDRFLADAMAVAANEPRGKRILFEAGLRPVETMLEQYFDDPLLVHALFSLISYPGAVGVLLLYMIGAICQGKMYRPQHWDHRRLAVLIHRKLRQWGGEVLYSTGVERILVENDKVVGVRLSSGEEKRAPLVVASTDLHQLYTRLLPGQYAQDPTIQRQLARPPGFSCFCLFLGLDAQLGNGGDEYAQALLADTVVWRRAPPDLTSLPLRVEHQTVHYPRLAPPGGATLCAWAVAPMSAFAYWGLGRSDIDPPGFEPDDDSFGYRTAKDEAAQILLQRLEGFYPDLRTKIVTLQTATPFTFQRYTRNRAGSVSGFSPSGVGYLKSSRFSTPVENLYHIGHWSVQSGVNSVMASAESLFQSLAGS